MRRGQDGAVTRDGASIGADLAVVEAGFRYKTLWTCEKWGEDKVDYARKVLERAGVTHVRDGNVVDADCQTMLDQRTGLAIPRFIPIEHGVPSAELRQLGLEPDEIEYIEGNLLLNEGLQRLIDLLIAAGGVAYNNANAFIGVGDSTTAEAATQTELQAATNRFYKAMVATYPIRTAQACDWRSDFTTTEANYAWQEWSVCAGATTASGAGFTSGTTNLNRKVQSLGTKTTGTWTLTSTITFS